MKSYKKDIEKLGTVLFERSGKAKHLNITVKPRTGVRVAVPYTISFLRAEKFVIYKSPWIQKQLIQLEKNFIKLQKFDPVDKDKARKILLNRLNELAKQFGFEYNKVSIRNQKTRWGSCSAKNNISLNMKIINLPDELIDFILLHELVHTKIKNHGKGFWQELSNYVEGINTKRKELRNFGFLLNI